MTVDNDEINRIPINEFQDLGYLQEVNRLFLHPLGLALEVINDEDGNKMLGGVQDYRHDPEGMNFGPNFYLFPKAEYIRQQWVERFSARVEGLGYMIQPATEKAPE